MTTMPGVSSGDALNHVTFIGDQTFVVDPRGQGFGLQDYEFLDPYANKFYILSGRDGLFISPKQIPDALVDYYGELGLNVAAHENIAACEAEADGSTLAARLRSNKALQARLAQRRGGLIVPHMVTSEVEGIASAHGMRVLTSADSTGVAADKAIFQERLAVIADDITEHVGYNVAMPAVRLKAGDRASVVTHYGEMGEGGRKDLVVVKPKSASALGIFVVRAESGLRGLEKILDSHFDEDEDILLEVFVKHNHSPSMQGVRLEGDVYKHLYLGRQIVSIQGERVEYDGSQIPFGPKTVRVNSSDLTKIERLHEAVGEALITKLGIAGIAGFDSVANITPNGTIEDINLTELNLHLPSSLAVYAAISKVFPEGFDGVAHNLNVPLSPGQTPVEFMRQIGRRLVAKKGSYGIFPLNLSYTDKIDLVAFAKDSVQLGQLLEGLRR